MQCLLSTTIMWKISAHMMATCCPALVYEGHSCDTETSLFKGCCQVDLSLAISKSHPAEINRTVMHLHAICFDLVTGHKKLVNFFLLHIFLGPRKVTRRPVLHTAVFVIYMLEVNFLSGVLWRGCEVSILPSGEPSE